MASIVETLPAVEANVGAAAGAQVIARVPSCAVCLQHGRAPHRTAQSLGVAQAFQCDAPLPLEEPLVASKVRFVDARLGYSSFQTPGVRVGCEPVDPMATEVIVQPVVPGIRSSC